MKQVIRLLEVPGEQVTVHSAAFALRRICELKDSTSDDIDSFIRKAIFNELCETVIREIDRLSSDMVVSMARWNNKIHFITLFYTHFLCSGFNIDSHIFCWFLSGTD